MLRAGVGLACMALSAGLQLGPAELTATLPGIEQVLAKAKNEVKEFRANAKAMQQAVAEQQRLDRLKFVERKRSYEARIAELALQNGNISVTNNKIRKGNVALRRSNRILEATLTELHRDNQRRRNIFALVGEKMGVASSFIQDSLELTDDTKAAELQVLAPTTPTPSLDMFLALAKDMNPSAMLQIPAGHADTEAAKELVDVLAKSLTEISSAEEQSEVEFNETYEHKFQARMLRQMTLNETQSRLLATQRELEQHRTRLNQAKVRLEATRQLLQDRRHALRVFAHSLEAALAEMDESSGVAIASSSNESSKATMRTHSAKAGLANRSRDDAQRAADAPNMFARVISNVSSNNTLVKASLQTAADINVSRDDDAKASAALFWEDETQPSMYMAAAAAAAAAVAKR